MDRTFQSSSNLASAYGIAVTGAVTIDTLLMAILLVGAAIWALVWAIRSGQFDDLESHGWDPVLDDDSRPSPGDERDDESPDGDPPGHA